jgi:hypothetical protein
MELSTVQKFKWNIFMKMYFKIIEVNKKEHSIIVRYWTDKISEDFLANYFNDRGDIMRSKNGTPIRCKTDFNLIFYDHEFPSMDEIFKEIRRIAPVQWLKTIEQIENPYIETSLENAEKMLYQTHELDFN